MTERRSHSLRAFSSSQLDKRSSLSLSPWLFVNCQRSSQLPRAAVIVIGETESQSPADYD